MSQSEPEEYQRERPLLSPSGGVSEEDEDERRSVGSKTKRDGSPARSASSYVNLPSQSAISGGSGPPRAGDDDGAAERHVQAEADMHYIFQQLSAVHQGLDQRLTEAGGPPGASQAGSATPRGGATPAEPERSDDERSETFKTALDVSEVGTGQQRLKVGVAMPVGFDGKSAGVVDGQFQGGPPSKEATHGRDPTSGEGISGQNKIHAAPAVMRSFRTTLRGPQELC